jgi:hypothetical protein
MTDKDIMIIKQALQGQSIKDLDDFKCKLEIVIISMQDATFIAEWNTQKIVEDQFMEKCSNSITWHLLLKKINPLINPGIIKSLPINNNTYKLAFRQALYCSVILQLYVALVYNREILNRVMKVSPDNSTSVNNLRELLSCNYLRHMRNSLAHGSFSIFAGGICFIDKDKKGEEHKVMATPSFLEYISSWLNLIILQAMK